MSQLGWIALTFDPRSVGDSEGRPIECDCNPYHDANDLAAWVGFVAALPLLDESNIFNAGVCAGALPAIYETFQDKRVKGLGLIVPSIVGSETMGGKWAPVRWIFYLVHYWWDCQFGGIKVKKAPPFPIDPSRIHGCQIRRERLGIIQHVLHWFRSPELQSCILILLPRNMEMIFPVFMATGDKAESLDRASRWCDLLPVDGTKKEKVMIAGATHTQFYYKQDLIDDSCVKKDAFFRKYF